MDWPRPFLPQQLWGARVPEHRALDVSGDAGGGFGSEVHVDVRRWTSSTNIAGISAWGTVDKLSHQQWRFRGRRQPDGARSTSSKPSFPQWFPRGRGGRLVNVTSAAGIVALPWHAVAAPASTGCAASRRFCVDLARHRIGVSAPSPGAVTPTVQDRYPAAGIDPTPIRGAALGQTVPAAMPSPRESGGEDLAGSRATASCLHLTDIRALVRAPRLAWWPQASPCQWNVLFTRAAARARGRLPR